MPWQKLPINQPLYANISEASLSFYTAERHDTYRNAAGATRRRPGLIEFCTIKPNVSIDGIYSWEEQNLIIIVADGNVYKATKTGLVTLLATDCFVKYKRPTFANFGYALYAANGNKIIKITPDAVYLLVDPNIPPNVTHVAAFDTYLLANEGNTGRMHFSEPLAPETWKGNFITAEQSPDKIIAMHAGWAEIWLFGTRSVECWYDDGVTPFAPIETQIISCGCIAPYTIQHIRDMYYWMNENREIVRSVGPQYEIISAPVHNFLKKTKTVTNAIADYINIEGNDFYILSLPDYEPDGITLVYDINKNEWQGEWNYWNSVEDKYERFRGNCHTYVSAWGKSLLGDRNNGKIYYMDVDKCQDAGDIMRSCWLTGCIDYGTNLKKRSYKIRFRMQRGKSEVNPVLMLRWRDDGSKIWSNTQELSLGKKGEYEFYASLNRLGSYRCRQYELSVTDNTPIALVDAEELIEVTNK